MHPQPRNPKYKTIREEMEALDRAARPELNVDHLRANTSGLHDSMNSHPTGNWRASPKR